MSLTPFLEEHLKVYRNAGKGNPSYLSAYICEEFIEIIGQQVFCAILEEIKESKYYSIRVDSTPDISHIDQLTFTNRYIRGSEPGEHFLKFIPIFSHGAKNLADTVVEFLQENNIPLSNCRGQSYDNASNMSGRYTGLHSLNLVGVKVAECGPQIVSFFDFIQHLYSFFSASTHRWNVLTSSLGKNHIVVKCLSGTRWSAHFDAVTALHGGFEKIQDALDALAVDADHKWNTRREAEGLSKKMEKLEIIFLTILWNDILGRVNKTSKILLSKNVDILVANDLLKSLKVYLQEMRDKFSEYEAKAKSRCPDLKYSDGDKRARKRSMHLTRYYGLPEQILLHETEKFKVETYLPLLDSLNSHLTEREAYESIENLFSLFSQLKTIDCNEFSQRCEKLANAYHEDLDYNELLNECKQFKHYIVHDEEYKTLPDVYRKLIPDKLKSVFPNVEIALKIFICMMVTNCTRECSFSRLKLTKYHLRSTMGQQGLNLLFLVCIESDILKNIDFQPIIKQFSAIKCRKFSS
ncbi:zinc finger protein 862-like [Limulus polyphemus]|uniref:Zinc finger protein 862-like n=1 Tax=Limulus polyphemus TaxID=6850 RepID=A0ABM1BTD7_LIMPO|nr:zinc finger protein 862-like [Limulus polyphemus]